MRGLTRGKRLTTAIQRDVSSCVSSNPLTVGPEGVFWWMTNFMDAPKQCTEMRFGWTKRVTIPAWVYGFIANGDTFRISIADPRPNTMLR